MLPCHSTKWLKDILQAHIHTCYPDWYMMLKKKKRVLYFLFIKKQKGMYMCMYYIKLMHKTDRPCIVSYNKTRRNYHLPFIQLRNIYLFQQNHLQKEKLCLIFHAREFQTEVPCWDRQTFTLVWGGRYQEWSWKQSPDQPPKPPPLSGPDTNTWTSTDKRVCLIHWQ